MAIAERTTSGFPMGWGIVALLLAAVVVLAPLAAMPVMMTETGEQATMTDEEWKAEYAAAKAAADKALAEHSWTNPQDRQAEAAAWRAVQEAQARQKQLLDERDAHRGVTLCEAKAPVDMTDGELRAELDAANIEVVAAHGVVVEWDEAASQEAFAAALAARQAASERYIAANEAAIARGWYSITAKVPADMTDEELRAELDAAQVEVAAAGGADARGWGRASQEDYEAVLATWQVAGERFAAAHEVAVARGWYKCIYTDTELAEVVAGIKAGTITFELVHIPGNGVVPVADDHIIEGHGEEAMTELKKGGFTESGCGDGHKKYWYKAAVKKGFWTIAILWDGVVVTTYDVTKELLLAYLKQDGCDPPPGLGHDMMGLPAY